MIEPTPTGIRVLGYHVPVNAAGASTSMNFMKDPHVPVVLPAIPQFGQADTQVQLENAWRGLINFHVNGLEVSYNLKTRLAVAEGWIWSADAGLWRENAQIMGLMPFPPCQRWIKFTVCYLDSTNPKTQANNLLCRIGQDSREDTKRAASSVKLRSRGDIDAKKSKFEREMETRRVYLEGPSTVARQTLGGETSTDLKVGEGEVMELDDATSQAGKEP